jgi:hypothetical protein
MRHDLAVSVADSIVAHSFAAPVGKATDVSVRPWVRLSIHPTERTPHVSELVWGGSNGMYGGFEGPIGEERKAAIVHAITQKARRGQLSTDIDHRVLLLQDRMMGIPGSTLDAAVSAVPTEVRQAFDEIALVSTYNDGSCYRVLT